MDKCNTSLMLKKLLLNNLQLLHDMKIQTRFIEHCKLYNKPILVTLIFYKFDMTTRL